MAKQQPTEPSHDQSKPLFSSQLCNLGQCALVKQPFICSDNIFLTCDEDMKGLAWGDQSNFEYFIVRLLVACCMPLFSTVLFIICTILVNVH